MLEKEKYKNTTCFECQDLCCFIYSVKFLRLWTYVDMDYGHNVRGRFFVLIGTSSAHIFERFKVKQETQFLLLGFTEHPAPTSSHRWLIKSGSFSKSWLSAVFSLGVGVVDQPCLVTSLYQRRFCTFINSSLPVSSLFLIIYLFALPYECCKFIT